MNPRIRYACLTICLLALASIPLFFGVPNPYNSIFLNQLNDWCHSLLFFGFQPLCFWGTHDIARKLSRNISIYLILLASSLFSLLVGAGIEVIQSTIDRDASWADVGRDVLGILIANGLIVLTVKEFRSRIIKMLGVLVSLSALVMSLMPVTPWLYAQMMRDQVFPALNNFENTYVNKYVFASAGARVDIIPAPSEWTNNRSRVAKITMPKGKRYPGLQLFNPEPVWGNYSTLIFDVYSPHDLPETVAINIYSIEKLRRPQLHQKFEITPGWQSYKMPIQELKGQHITDVIWHTINPDHDVVVYLDNIRLE